MALVTHKILFKQLGENATTPRDPVAVVNGEPDVDLNAETTVCVSSDNDMLTAKKTYSIGEITLPEWLPPEEWLRNTTAWKWLWGLGADPTWSEAWQRGLVNLGSTAHRLAAVKLLRTKKFRSNFRESLRDRLVEWLDTPVDERRYDSPFSYRQWGCLVNRYVAREAKQIDSNLYYSKGIRDASQAA